MLSTRRIDCCVSNGIVEPGAFPFIPDLAEALDLPRPARSSEADRRSAPRAGHGTRPAARARHRGEMQGAHRRGAGGSTRRAARARAGVRGARACGDPVRVSTHPPDPRRDAPSHEEEAGGSRVPREVRGRSSRLLGASLWEARADQALARIGGRSASPTELSETERRVADVVAQGLTNKEAAERLFMSVKTVESNLRRIYRKLGIRSRAELARRHASSVTERRAPSRSEHQT